MRDASGALSSPNVKNTLIRRDAIFAINNVALKKQKQSMKDALPFSSSSFVIGGLQIPWFIKTPIPFEKVGWGISC